MKVHSRYMVKELERRNRIPLKNIITPLAIGAVLTACTVYDNINTNGVDIRVGPLSYQTIDDHSAKRKQLDYKEIEKTLDAEVMDRYRAVNYESIDSLCSIFDFNPDLLRAQMHQESKGDIEAISGKGAKGLMQIMLKGAFMEMWNLCYDPDPHYKKLREENNDINSLLYLVLGGVGTKQIYENLGMFAKKKNLTPKDSLNFEGHKKIISRIISKSFNELSPQTNIELGLAYDVYLRRQIMKDYRLNEHDHKDTIDEFMLAAYNAGPGALRSSIRKYGVIPQNTETKPYVEIIMKDKERFEGITRLINLPQISMENKVMDMNDVRRNARDYCLGLWNFN